MSIPLFKTWVHSEALENVKRVFDSGWLGLGKETEEFEKEFANYLGSNYCVALNSGTAALDIAVASLDLPPKSLVITTPNTFVSTNHVLLYHHLEPIFAAIDETGNISTKSIDRILNWNWPNHRKIAAIMVVHYGGQPADLDGIYGLADQYDIPVIEDCAHACGATYKGKKIGSESKLATFSFHAVKNLAIGDGGALVTNSEEIYEFARKMRWLGIDKSTADRSKGTYSWEYEVPLLGYKSHMNDITAAIARAQLLYIDQDNDIRQLLVTEYKRILGGIRGVKPLPLKPDRTSSNHLFVVRFEEFDFKRKAMEALAKNDIQFGYHYRANYSYPMYKNFMRDKGAEMKMFELTALTLPLHLELMPKDITDIVNTIKEGIK